MNQTEFQQPCDAKPLVMYKCDPAYTNLSVLPFMHKNISVFI